MTSSQSTSLQPIGFLRPRPSREIAASKIGIGFECLDRKMWDDTDEVYRLVGELGVKHARVQTGWSRCEETLGVYDFAWLDRIVDKLLAQGIQPWLNVGYGNIHHTDTEHPDAVGWAPIRSEESKAAWCRYVAALVQHFRDRITHYEVWNEPDINCFWVGDSNPHEYMELLKLTVPVIREHQPDVKIIGAAIARGLSSGGAAFLEEYMKDGLVDLIDVYSFHRYHVHPELNRPCDVASIRATFKQYGGEHIEIWQAESGCPSVPSPTQALANVPVSEEVQAQVLARSLLTDLTYGFDYTCYFHLSDFKFYYRNGFCEVPNYFGLLTFDDPPRCKLSYSVMQNLCALFDQDTVLNPRGIVELGFAGMNASDQKYAFQETIIATKTGVFQRQGKPMAAWWYPGDLLAEVAGNAPRGEQSITLYVWSPEGTIETPVVIDPMTGEVFEVSFRHAGFAKGVGTQQLVLENVPLRTTPLIVADRSVIDMQ